MLPGDLRIDSAQDTWQRPPQTTGLGGLVKLHGHGGGEDWTWGCIATEDNEIDAGWAVLALGYTIVVFP